MNTTLKLKSGYDSLDKIEEFIKSESDYSCSQEYDHWELRTDKNNQMEKCIVIKGSGMHGAKVYLSGKDTLNIQYIIPSKLLHAYFGKSAEARRNIVEIILGKVRDMALSSSQQKSFQEITSIFNKISA